MHNRTETINSITGRESALTDLNWHLRTTDNTAIDLSNNLIDTMKASELINALNFFTSDSTNLMTIPQFESLFTTLKNEFIARTPASFDSTTRRHLAQTYLAISALHTQDMLTYATRKIIRQLFKEKYIEILNFHSAPSQNGMFAETEPKLFLKNRTHQVQVSPGMNNEKKY